jgi:hypothetical protein
MTFLCLHFPVATFSGRYASGRYASGRYALTCDQNISNMNRVM